MANSGSSVVALSGDGRYVAFASYASNLVPHDNNNAQDVLLRDRRTGKTTVASIAPDGSRILDAFEAAMSTNGRYVVSVADNGAYLRDMTTGKTRLVSMDQNGRRLDLISSATVTADGKKVAFGRVGFIGEDTEISQVWLWTASSGHATLIRPHAEHPVLSQNGAFLAYQDWMTGVSATQVHVINLAKHTDVLASIGPSGAGNFSSQLLSITPDGRYVGFTSNATNLAGRNANALSDVFVRDLVDRTTTRVSVSSRGELGNGTSYGGWLSADGHYVGFWSDASNLVAGDSNGQADVFVHSLRSGNTYRVSLTSTGGQVPGASYGGMISADGHHVAFETMSNGVTPGDTNGQADVFLRDAATTG